MLPRSTVSPRASGSDVAMSVSTSVYMLPISHFLQPIRSDNLPLSLTNGHDPLAVSFAVARRVQENAQNGHVENQKML